MSVEVNTEAVPGADMAVPVDPSMLNQPQDVANPSADPNSELLKHKLGLANQHAKSAKKEVTDLRQQNEALAAEMQKLKDAQQSAVRQNLEDQGAFRELYEQEKERAKKLESRLLMETADLKGQLESVTQTMAAEKLKAQAINTLSNSNALSPEQMYMLLQPMLRTDDEGKPVVLSEGVEQPFGDYVQNLKQSSQWQHHFGASSSRGIGATDGSASVAPGMANPYRNGNLTEAIRLEVENPDLARALRSEARKG